MNPIKTKKNTAVNCLDCLENGIFAPHRTKSGLAVFWGKSIKAVAHSFIRKTITKALLV